MTNRDLMHMASNWHKLGNITGYTLLMELRRNKRLIDNFFKKLEKIRQETPEYKKFRDEYLSLRREYADVDSSGQPIMTQVPNQPGATTYQIKTKAAEFAKVEQEVIKKYADVLKLMDDKNEKYETELNKECTLNFYVVSESHIQKNITNEQLDLLDFMIEYEEEGEVNLRALDGTNSLLKIYNDNKGKWALLGVKSFKQLLEVNGLQKQDVKANMKVAKA